MITLKDVAEIAGCDISTVSRVLNGRPNRVSEVNRNRIHEIARQLGYVANHNASALAFGATRMIGLLVPNVFDGVYAEYIETLDMEFSAEGYMLRPFICHNRPDKEHAALGTLLHHEVDAMISMYYAPDCREFYERIQQSRRPLIFRCTTDIEAIPFSSVRMDLPEGYGELAAHLAAAGCRRIAVVGGSVAGLLHRGGESVSLRNFRNTCNTAGIAVTPASGVVCDDHQDAAFEAISRLYGNGGEPPFDGLIIQSINRVFGACKALMDAGFSIPRDVKVASFSDLPICRYYPVPLTVWAQPVGRICHALAEALLTQLRTPDAPLSTVNFQSELIVRESTQSTQENI